MNVQCCYTTQPYYHTVNCYVLPQQYTTGHHLMMHYSRSTTS